MRHLVSIPVAMLIFTGCIRYNTIPAAPYAAVEPPAPPVEKTSTPTPPKSAPLAQKSHAHKPKPKPVPVEDDNFSPEYMYPQTDTPKSAKKKQTQNNTAALPAIDKKTCISMIGEEKFKRYTEMLGGEAGALKRCALLRSMQ